MKVISLNVNGIRSAGKKGFFAWLEAQDADVVCLQEVRAWQEQLTDEIYYPEGYHVYYVDAEKKGYSGVAIYSRLEPKNVTTDLGITIADEEGRYLQLDFGNMSIASIYLPSGTSGDVRQDLKYSFMDEYLPILKKQLKSKKSHILCGDWNIAHNNIDIKNWKSNKNNSGFLPEERAWLDVLFNKVGYIDSFRHLHPEKTQYTWWSNRANAWANNVGWRIDYQVITPDLASKLEAASVYREEKFSDHAPLIHEYAIELT